MSTETFSSQSPPGGVGVGKLSSLIQSTGVSFGATPQGRSWALRALHPSDDGVRVEGIPDRTCIPTGLLHFKSTAVLSYTTGSYDADFVFIPSPLLFGTASVYPAGGLTAAARLDMVNSQIPGGPTTSGLAASWRTNVSAARIAYYGVTLYYDAPSLYDQGGVLGAQLPASFTYQYPATGNPIAIYSGGPLRFDQLMGLPLAVQHQAKLGMYCPIKLSQPSLPFRDQQTLTSYSGWYPTVTGAPASYTLAPMMDTQLCAVSFRNVAAQASIRVVIRMGVEFTPVSFSAYSPFTRSSPVPDGLALDAYFRTSGSMVDGWPSDYNDLGKLSSVLKSIAKVAWPVVRSVIGAVPGGGSLLEAGGQLVKAVRATRPPQAKKKKANGNGRKT